MVDKNYSVREAFELINVGKSTVDKWARQLERDAGTLAASPVASDKIKICELEKRIKGIEEEKEILKKAIALLMSDSMRGSR